MIDIKGISKAELLAKLYNYARPQGLGLLHFEQKDMTLEEAQKLVDKNRSLSFDYVQGRVLKVNLARDLLETRLYDRDNGAGAASAATGLPEVEVVND
ncbi:hypothetical protein [Acidiferrobacter sp.]|uniref:hypothetical protein n=1 Tax=Acidiferrobacter sp. TaxID=1872107 RepID=UPI0026111DFB|nr:hypothetical protein [Acidiferrobacter sp.]